MIGGLYGCSSWLGADVTESSVSSNGTVEAGTCPPRGNSSAASARVGFSQGEANFRGHATDIPMGIVVKVSSVDHQPLMLPKWLPIDLTERHLASIQKSRTRNGTLRPAWYAYLSAEIMAERIPGPTCSERCGPNWIDDGTMCRQRSPAPGPTGAEIRPAFALPSQIPHYLQLVGSRYRYRLNVYQFATRVRARPDGTGTVIVGRSMIWRHVREAVRIWRATGVFLDPVFHAPIDSRQETALLEANNQLDYPAEGESDRERLSNSEEMDSLWRWREDRWHNGSELAVFFVDLSAGPSRADPERRQVYVDVDPGSASVFGPPEFVVGRVVAHELGHIFLQALPGRAHDLRSRLMDPPHDSVAIDNVEAEVARTWVRTHLTPL